MTIQRIDLHCHSTASDGRMTPVQLIEHAKKLGLRALGLSDHDTLAGLAMLHTAGKKHGIETVSGVEVSADYAKGSMHIMGFFVEAEHQGFRSFLKQLSDGRKVRNPKIVARLNELGMNITMQEVEAEAGIRPDSHGGVGKNVGRPHIAAVMIKKGYVKTKQEAFDRFLAKGCTAYVTRFVASPQESINQIHDARGLAVLAHPAYLNATDDDEMDRIFGDLKAKGLDGVEVWFSTHTPAQTALYERLAKKHDLVATGGSDFHGEVGRGGAEVEMGFGINGSLCVAYEVLENLKARRKNKLKRG